MTKEEFFANVAEVEEFCWFPYGRHIDGAPYSIHREYWDWLHDAVEYFGGMHGIRKLVQKRKAEGEEKADDLCGNWWLWTILNELGVSRVRD